MGLFNRYEPKRLPAQGYNLVSARRAILFLAHSADCEHIREEAKKHLRTNLSDDKKDALKNRFSSIDPGTRAAIESRLSRFDPAECEHDEEFLLWVLHQAYCWKDNLVAIKHIADQAELKDIAIKQDSPNSEQRMTALSRLIDQDLILEVVLNANDTCRDVLEEGLRRLPNDPKLMAKIASKAISSFIRVLAIENIVDQKLLRKIAFKSLDPDVSQAAMSRINQKAEVKKIIRYRQLRDPMNTNSAYEDLDDQRLIAKLARYGEDKQNRLQAIKKLNKKRTLKFLAKYDVDLDIRAAAARQLSDDVLVNRISVLIKANEEEKQARSQDLKNELIVRVKEYLSNMDVIPGKWSVDYTHVTAGSLNDVIKEMDKHGLFYVRHDDPRETYRIMSYDCKTDCASYRIDVRNYMSDGGYVYDDISRLIIRRIDNDRFIWHQEEEARDLNP